MANIDYRQNSVFYRPDASCCPTNSIKALKANNQGKRSVASTATAETTD